MYDTERKYENRYWLVDDDVFELHFNQFYDDETMLTFMQDEEDSENYIYASEFLKVPRDEIIAGSIDDAMERFEDMIIEHIEDQISYYKDMLEKFHEETYE